MIESNSVTCRIRRIVFDSILEGCSAAVNEWQIEYCEMLSMTKSFVRLFRKEEYPPLRGTLLTLEENIGHLYTRGSVEFYETYPGMYMPRTLRIEAARTERSLESHAEEILALTKMNWNDTPLQSVATFCSWSLSSSQSFSGRPSSVWA